MYALNISYNEKDFKPYFQNGRLRRYKNLPLAKNASKQLLNNTKNQITAIQIFLADNSQIIATIINGQSDFTDVLPAGKQIVDTTLTTPVKEPVKELPVLDIPVKKRENTVPVDSLILKPKEETQSQLDRKQFLMECHEKHKKKAEQDLKIEAGDSLNNVATPQTESKAKEFIDSFTACVLESAIKDNDYKTLFNTEVMLAQRGYSWYPDENNHIQIAPTDKVLEIINKKDESKHV
jgi:hypothetical protein